MRAARTRLAHCVCVCGCQTLSNDGFVVIVIVFVGRLGGGGDEGEWEICARMAWPTYNADTNLPEVTALWRAPQLIPFA